MVPSSALKLLATAVLVVASSACTLRYSHASFPEDELQAARSGVPIEGGMRFVEGSPSFGRVELGLMGSYQAFDFFTPAAIAYIEAQGRVFPWPNRSVQPFVGGGLGINRLWATETTRRCGRQQICTESESTADQRRIATGFNPHWTVGVEYFPGTSEFGLVAAFTHEFLSDAPEWSLDSRRFAAGVVWRPRSSR